MAESIAGSYATLAGIEIVNDARTSAYLKNGLAPGGINVYGDCGCANIQELLGCTTPTEFDTIDGLNLTGNNGSYASAVNSAPLTITGDLYLGAKFKATDLTPAAAQNLVAKWVEVGDERAYRLQVNTSGGLSLSWSTNGAAGGVITRNSTAALPFIDGTTIYVYATLDVDNGAAGHDVKFYYSTSGITYTPLGTVVTTAGTTSIDNGISPVELGSQDNGTANRFVGVIYNAVIRNGIPPLGTVVGSPDFQPQDPAVTTASTSVTDDQGNVWTRHGDSTFLPGTVTVDVMSSYSSPSTDDAPWYTADNPASSEFAGFVLTEFVGMDSPFTRSVTETVGNGGVLNRSRLTSRKLTWKGFLFGATCCSVQYGLRWLTKTLSRFDASCRDCFGDDLELLVCCPETGEAGNSPIRLLKGVSLLEGPKVLSEHKTCNAGCSYGSCGGSCVLEIEFTLVASQPYFYSPPIPVYDCVNLGEEAVVPYTDAQIDCGPTDCSDVIFEVGSLCPLPELPPIANYTNSCATDFNIPAANYFSVSRSYWSDLEEVVPVISITAGALILIGLKLGFYSSASDSPCSDLSLYPPNCDVICDELNIIAIPANSTFYIDGRTRKMSVICPDGAVYPGERLTSGPWSWPTFDCYGFCMEVLFENELGAQVPPTLACVSLSLVPRTF